MFTTAFGTAMDAANVRRHFRRALALVPGVDPNELRVGGWSGGERRSPGGRGGGCGAPVLAAVKPGRTGWSWTGVDRGCAPAGMAGHGGTPAVRGLLGANHVV